MRRGTFCLQVSGFTVGMAADSGLSRDTHMSIVQASRVLFSPEAGRSERLTGRDIAVTS